MVLSEKSYSPSDVLIRLLYLHLAQHLSKEILSQMSIFTREQIRYGFAGAVDAIRYRNVLDVENEDEYWIVDRDCELRQEVLKEIERRVDLHHSAEFDGKDFKLRFGEEIYSWFLRNEEEAHRFGLKRDKYHRVVVCKEQPIDVTGCS